MALAVKRDKCVNHPQEDGVGSCGYCNKPICRDCINAHGYYCSDDCKQRNTQSQDEAYQAHKSVSMASIQSGMRAVKLTGLAVLVLLLAGMAYLVYSLFLDPSGKIVWTWAESEALTARVVGADDDHVYVLTDEGLYTLDPKDGRTVRTCEDDDLTNMDTAVVADGRFCAANTMRVVSMPVDATEPQVIELRGTPTGAPSFAPDGRSAVYLTRTRAADAEDELAYDLVAHVLDLETGEHTAAYTLPAGTTRAQLLAVDRDSLVLLAGVRKQQETPKKPQDKRRQWFADGTADSDWSLLAVALDSGRRQSKRKLDGHPGMDLKYDDGWVLFLDDDKLRAINLAAKKDHTFKVEVDDYVTPGYVIDRDQLFVLYETGIICYDLTQKDPRKPTWALNAGVGSEAGLMFCEDRIVVSGAKSDKLKIDLSAAPGFNQAPEGLLEQLGAKGQNTLQRSTPLLAAVNRETGTFIWATEGPKTRGHFLADGERLVLVADVAQLSPLAAVTNRDPKLFVRQFDFDNGEELYTTTTEYVTVEPLHICGDRVIGRRMQAAADGGLNLDADALVGIDLR